MRANEFITELGNKPYPFKITDNDKYYKVVSSKDGKIDVSFEVKLGSEGSAIDIMFMVDGSTKMTGGGDQFRIFSTVAKIIEKRLPVMIKQLDPYAIWFHAKNDEASRVSLYNKYGVNFFNKLLGPDWKFQGAKQGPTDTLYQWNHAPQI